MKQKKSLKKIGIFDSGIGGLAVLKHVAHRYPAHYLYCADSSFFPYGDKTDQEIIDRCIVNVNLLKEHNVDAVIVACHTASAIAFSTLREQFPDLLLFDMVEPCVHAVYSETTQGRIGIMATPATARQQRYTRIFNALDASLTIREYPFVHLASQIEATSEDRSFLQEQLTQDLSQIKHDGIDTLILGCTHYELVESQIQKILPATTIVSAGRLVAERIAKTFASGKNESTISYVNSGMLSKTHSVDSVF